MQRTVGLAYEGNRDLEAIKVIVQRLGEMFGYELNLSRHKRGVNNAHTAILKYVTSFTQYMFDEAGVDFAFYFTDQDKDSADRRRLIADKIEAYSIDYRERSFVGVPIPHFEKWLLVDEDVVKSVLHYDHTKPLEFSELSPKNQLQALVQCSEVDIFLDDAKIEIAKNMSFDKLKHARVGFDGLCDDVRRKLAGQ